MAQMHKRALRVVRRHMGGKTQLEREVRAMVNRQRFRTNGFAIRTDACVIDGARSRPFGVYAYGGCDLDAVVPTGRYLRREVTTLASVIHVGDIAIGRTDFILQGLEAPPPAQHVAEAIDRLGLASDHFAPTLFDPTFVVPHYEHLGPFTKNVIVLSLAPDMTRTMYRHREHGYLLDPGGFWLGSDMSQVLGDLDTVKWFAGNFQKMGRISIEDSMENLGRIITHLRTRLGSDVIVANALVVDPGVMTFDYRLSHSPQSSRRRRFVLALVELSRRLDVPILDIDTLAKRDGVTAMADFVHYTPRQKDTIGRELAGMLVRSGLVTRHGAA